MALQPSSNIEAQLVNETVQLVNLDKADPNKHVILMDGELEGKALIREERQNV